MLKTKFDRRPSVVLEAWAKPELKPYDPSEEKDKEKDGEAAPPKPRQEPSPTSTSSDNRLPCS